jgi:hypothetical protein
MPRARRKPKRDKRTFSEILSPLDVTCDPPPAAAEWRHALLCDADADGIVRACIEASKRQERIEQVTRDYAALRARLSPAFVAALDGLIAARTPGLLIDQAKILLDGADGLYEEMLAAASVSEFDALKSLLDVVRGRIAEIRRAIDPLVRPPS